MMTGALMIDYMMIRHSQLVLATTLTFNTVKIQAAQLEWSLITPLSLMVMSAAQTHVCEELALTSFQIIDATAPQVMVEDDVNKLREGYASLLEMVMVLPDRDGWFNGDSDPYVRVIAYNSSGSPRSLRTGDDAGNESPEWNQWLDFGVDSWSRFTVQVYDEDSGSDDSLSSVSTYYLSTSQGGT